MQASHRSEKIDPSRRTYFRLRILQDTRVVVSSDITKYFSDKDQRINVDGYILDMVAGRNYDLQQDLTSTYKLKNTWA